MLTRQRIQFKRPAFKKSGSVLVLTVLIVAICLVIGASQIVLGTRVRVAALNKVHDMKARTAADAGLEYALQHINNAVADHGWSPWVCPTTSDSLLDPESQYTVRTRYTYSGYKVESVGTHRNRSHEINAKLRLKGLFEMGIQSRDEMILKSGSSVRVIDSDISLNPDDAEGKVIVGTNSVETGSVVLYNHVVVDGDVVVGVGGDVDKVIKDLGASTLDRYPLTADLEFPTVEPPGWTWPGMRIEVTRGEKTVGFGGDYPPFGRFSDIYIKKGCRLRILNDCVLYVTGDVDMGQSSEIVIDSDRGASLKMYLDGDWQSDNSASVTNTGQKTSAFQLYGTGTDQEIDLKAKNDFFGSIYAPNADVTVYAQGDVYGSVVADDFELKSKSTFYYDLALRDVSVYDVGARYVVNRWNEQ